MNEKSVKITKRNNSTYRSKTVDEYISDLMRTHNNSPVLLNDVRLLRPHETLLTDANTIEVDGKVGEREWD